MTRPSKKNFPEVSGLDNDIEKRLKPINKNSLIVTLITLPSSEAVAIIHAIVFDQGKKVIESSGRILASEVSIAKERMLKFFIDELPESSVYSYVRSFYLKPHLEV